jgi:VIT1/CCC1 family predicted Fe2+/Mn2+ transporter
VTTEPKQPQTATAEDIKRYQANLDDEIDGIAVYEMLAKAEKDPRKREIFFELADVERRHAGIWRQKLIDAGAEPRERGPGLRARMLGLLARVFGVRPVLPIVRALEAGAYSAYMAQDETAKAMAPDERQHRKTVSRLQRGQLEASEVITARETWHRAGGGGTLRATVFGVSDGLVSNTALVMGFAGARVEGELVLLAGVSGLLAGAFSMGGGEYVSMRAQRELFERQIELEREELETAPEEELRELSLIYQAKGLPEAEAEQMAANLMRDPEVALDTLVREELGLDPGELGSPWGASIGSFVAFSLGAIVPVLPFLFAIDSSTPYVVASATLGAAAMFAVGAALSLFTGRSALASGLRQLSLGAAAAALTFAIGRIIGVSAGI